MEIRLLYTLAAIADHGSFAQAARELGLSVSAVSLQMRGLEEETGLRLFDRSRRPPELTGEGRALLARAREVLASWESLTESLRREGEAGRLRIGAVHTVVSGLLPVALAAFRAAMPGVAVHLTTALTHELEAALRQGRIDVAVCTEPGTVSADLAFRPVVTERLVAIAPADAPGATVEALLTANPYVRFARQARVAALVEEALAGLGIAPASSMEIDTLEGVVSLVAAGLGVSVVPEPCGGRPWPEGLRMLPLGVPPATRTLGTLIRADTVRRRFAEALHAALAAASRPGAARAALSS